MVTWEAPSALVQQRHVAVLYCTVLYCTVLYWLPRWRLVQQRHVAVRRGHRAGGVAGQAATVVGGDSVAHAAVPSTSVIIGVHITQCPYPGL